MSVHARELPYWGRYAVCESRMSSIRRMARRFGLGDADAEDIGKSITIGICLEGKKDYPDEASVLRRFFTRSKYAMIELMERYAIEESVEAKAASLEARRGRTFDSEDGALAFARGTFHHVMPDQIDVTYVHECLKYLDKLPSDYRRIMRKIARGDTPLEIAKAENADVSVVLREIKIARDWILDHTKWGEGANQP